MVKLNTCYIVRDETDEIFELSVRNVMPITDRFIFVIDRPDFNTWKVIEMAQESKPVITLHHRYLHESKQADGLQRLVYLDWLKKNAEGESALILDSDEIIADNSHDLLKYLDQDCAYNVRMEHLWWALGLADATFEKHYVPKRLFKIKPGLSYPLVEHPILQGHEDTRIVDDVTIFHFNVLKGILEELRKYKVQCKKSNIHTREQLLTWHLWHIIGSNIPLRQFNPVILPRIVRDYFCIDDNGQPKFWEGE